MWIGWMEEMLLIELVLTIFSSLTDQDGVKCKCKVVGTITRLVEVIIGCIYVVYTLLLPTSLVVVGGGSRLLNLR